MQVDLHFHLLPDVDDGPADLAATLALARAAVADGTHLVVATPHVGEVIVAELPDRVAQVRSALREHGIALEVVCGGELNARDVAAASPDELELISVGPPGERWILLEPPFRELGPVPEAAEQLRDAGYGVVIAHPERAPVLWEAGVLERELELGAVAQVSAESLLGAHGPAVRERARELVRRPDAAVVVASDAHSADGRPPRLRAAREALGGGGLARRLIDDGPAALVRGGVGALERARPRSAGAGAGTTRARRYARPPAA